MAKRRPKIPRATRLAVYERDQWTCQYCGLKMRPKTDNELRGLNAPTGNDSNGNLIWLELDHVLPYSLGGACTIDNLRSACSPCNYEKRASTMRVDWASRIELARSMLEQCEPGPKAAEKAARVLLGVNLRIEGRDRVTLL